MERIDFLKFALESVDSDLKFAETKNTFLSTFNAAVLGVVIAYLSSDISISNCQKLLLVLFSSFVVIATITSVISFLPLSKLGVLFSPQIETKPPKYMFYFYNRSKYFANLGMDYDKFEFDMKQYLNDGEDFSGYEKQFIIQLLDISNIAYTKFKLFAIALYIELIAFIPFIAFLIIM